MHEPGKEKLLPLVSDLQVLARDTILRTYPGDRWRRTYVGSAKSTEGAGARACLEWALDPNHHLRSLKRRAKKLGVEEAAINRVGTILGVEISEETMTRIGEATRKREEEKKKRATPESPTKNSGRANRCPWRQSVCPPLGQEKGVRT